MTLRLIERIATQTLFGVRFWDPVIDRQVADGLVVTARRLGAGGTPIGRTVTARRTQGGVYAFEGLLPDERPPAVAPDERPKTLWEHAPNPRPILVEVVDTRGRFFPMAFEAVTPTRGPFPEGQNGVFLWSASGRAVPAGMTALYAQLVDGVDDGAPPAAYALVKVSAPGKGDDTWIEHAVGFADGQGRLTLPIPYPTIREPEPDGNGADVVLMPLGDQTFELRVQVFFENVAPVRQGRRYIDIAAILKQADQPRTVIITQRERVNEAWQRTEAAQAPVALTFGAPLVLRTVTVGAARPDPVLRVRRTA